MRMSNIIHIIIKRIRVIPTKRSSLENKIVYNKLTKKLTNHLKKRVLYLKNKNRSNSKLRMNSTIVPKPRIKVLNSVYLLNNSNNHRIHSKINMPVLTKLQLT